MRGNAPRRSWLWILILVVGASGCSTYSNTSSRLRDSMLGGDYDGALEELDSESDDVLILLERGLLLSYAGRFQQSNASFHLAEQRVEDLYTKSISREAAAFITNDATIPYTGYEHEHVLLHLYSALNYLSLNDSESALVECRRAGLRLAQIEDQRSTSRGYQYDGFAEYLSAILYAEDGDANATMVAARRALTAYEHRVDWLGHPVPEMVVHDAMDWAERFGFSQEAVEIAERFPEQAATRPTIRADEGEIVLLYESGFISSLVEVRFDFPILKNDSSTPEELGPEVYARGARGHYVVPSNRELDYWLSVAMPTMVHEPPLLTHARLRSTDGATALSTPVEDVSAIAQLLFDEKSANRTIRTIIRGLAKYALKEAAEEESKTLGLIANIFGSVTERADTRSWSTLPDQVHMARLRLPEGTHRIVVEVLDAAGEVGETATFEDVEVHAGDLTLLQHRSYE